MRRSVYVRDLLRWFVIGGLVLGARGTSSASAQYHGATDGVMVPVSSLLGQDDAIATEVNPALLGQLPAWSLAYVHAEVDQRGEWLGRGDAVHLGVPLFFNFAAGLSLHSVRPRPRAFQPGGQSAERAQAALSLAWAPSPRFGIGLTTRGVSSQRAGLDGLGALDLGMVWRPSTTLGFSFVGRDLFVSREGFGTAGLDLETTLEAGVQLRPLGTRDVILDLGVATAFEGQVAGRAGLGLEIPGVGMASALAEVERMGSERAALRLVAELSVSYGRSTLAVGGMGGDGFDSFEGGRLDWYAMAKVEGASRAGVPVGGYVLNLKLSDVSARRLLSVSVLLERLRHDPRVAGVLLRPRDTGMGSAYAQELRQQIRALQRAGKPVVCHLENASGAEFYACAAADETLMDPAGSLRFMGGSATVLMLGGTLQKLGVKAEFVRIGAFKSAPEQYTERRMSEPAREQLAGMMDDVYRRVVNDVARDLEVPPGRVETLMDDGPQLSTYAVEHGMVAGVADEVKLPELPLGPLGQRPLVEGLSERYPGHFGMPSRIGVVMIDGAIVDGDSVDVPLLGTHMSGARTVIRAIEGLASDPTVRAIVVRVDSPGGAVLASDQIWRAIYRARDKKPVIASLGAVAASGGYYVASAAQEIWADPSTVTGSIGIFYGKVDVSPLAEKLGASVEVLQRGRRAGADSMWRSFTADERAALAERLRAYYRVFLARVAEGRDMQVERVDELGRGHVYTGDAARELGLVDHLGGFASALRAARRQAHLGPDAPVVVVPELDLGIFGLLGAPRVAAGAGRDAPLSVDDGEASPLSALPGELGDLADLFSVLHQLDGTRAMALLPFAIDL